ncbi:MFS general substrate transporter [Meredithblackwellia eburnea MCA 4105]
MSSEKEDKDMSVDAEAPVPPEEDFPEGGLRAYLAVLGAHLTLMATFGLCTAYGTFQSYYKNQLASYPPSTISWIGSCQNALGFAGGLVSGRFFDRGWYQYQLGLGSCLWILGIFTLSASTTYVQIFLSQGICLGLGLGTVFSPTLSCISTYFRRKRTMMIGCCAAGASLGSIFWPILLAKLFPRIGFAPTIRILGYIMIGLLLAANLLIRPRKITKKATPPIKPLLRKIFRQPSFWFTAGGALLIAMATFIGFFYAPVFIETHGASPIVGTYALAILNSSAVIARVTAGLIADKFGVFNAAIPCGIAVGALLIAMLGATNTAGAVIFLLLFGVFTGAFVSITAGLFFSLSEGVEEMGVRGGLGFAFLSVAVLCGSPIAGALLTAAGHYYAPCLFAGLAAIIGGLLLVLARRTQVARKSTWRV